MFSKSKKIHALGDVTSTFATAKFKLREYVARREGGEVGDAQYIAMIDDSAGADVLIPT